MKFDKKWTWNGEAIRTDSEYIGCYAVLDEYDPTPWDYDTPARGPHATVGHGDTPAQAVCDLIEQLWEAM